MLGESDPSPAFEPESFVARRSGFKLSGHDTELLRLPARTAWRSALVHAVYSGTKWDPPAEGSAHALEFHRLGEEAGPGGPWNAHNSNYLLRIQVDSCSEAATGYLAAAAGVIWSGEASFSISPLVRGAVEAAVTGCWLLSDEISPRIRTARLFMNEYWDLCRRIDSAPSAEVRGPIKKVRREAHEELCSIFSANEIELDDGGRIAAVAGETFPTFESRFVQFDSWLGTDKHWRRSYGMLSQLAHPNPGTYREFGDGDIEGVVSLLRLGVQTHYLLLCLIQSYYGMPVDPLREWKAELGVAFPGSVD